MQVNDQSQIKKAFENRGASLDVGSIHMEAQ